MEPAQEVGRQEAIAGLCLQEEGEAICVSVRHGSMDVRSEDNVGQWASSDGRYGVGVRRVGDETDISRRQRMELSHWQVAESVNDVPGVGRRRDMEYFLLM